jgi:hypothetical protein
MNFITRWLNKRKNYRKAGALTKQAGKLDVRKQQIERDYRRERDRMQELRARAAEAKQQGNTGRLDDLLAEMNDLDYKMRNANFLLNNLNKKREKLLRAAEIYRTASDDIFSGEDVDVDSVEDLDAQIAIETEDLEREHRMVSRLDSTLADTRERLSDTQRDDLLKKFDLDADAATETVADATDQRQKAMDEEEEMRQAEEMEALLKESMDKKPDKKETEYNKTDPLGKVIKDTNSGMKQG